MSLDTDRLRHEIQTALAELREGDAALAHGETSRARDVISATIAQLEGLLHDAEQEPRT